jgi:hypothetical protein
MVTARKRAHLIARRKESRNTDTITSSPCGQVKVDDAREDVNKL